MDVRGEAGDRPQPFEDGRGVSGADLEDGPELLGEERGQGLRAERGEIDAKPRPSRERHLAQGRGEAAVGTVVAGDDRALGDEGLDRLEESAQHVRVHIRRIASPRGEDLGEGGAPEPVAAEPEVGEQETVVRVLLEDRGDGPADVGDRRERRHDEGEGSAHHALAAPFAPRGPHGQAVLADRDRDPQLRAEVEGGGPDRVVEGGIVLAGIRHPVRRQHDGAQRPDTGRGEVGEGLSDRHADRCGRVEDGEGSALSHRHRPSGEAEMVGRGDRAVGDRNLPGADHLVPGDETRNGAVRDGDEEALVGDARQPQEAAENGRDVALGRQLDPRPAGLRPVEGLAREAGRAP